MEISGGSSTSALGGLTTLVGGANGGSSNLGEGGDMEISGGSSTSALGGLTTLVGDAGGGSSTSSLGGFGGTAAEAPFVSSTVSFRKGGSWLHPYSGISIKDLTASLRHTKNNLMLKFRL